MINQLCNQPLQKKPFPKKPSSKAASNALIEEYSPAPWQQQQDQEEADLTFPGEFHTCWEERLWYDTAPPAEEDTSFNIDSLDRFAHGDEAVSLLTADPVLTTMATMSTGQIQDQGILEVMEMEVETNPVMMAPPENAFILADANTDNYLDLENFSTTTDSIDFNSTIDSGFDDSFQGWGAESLLDPDYGQTTGDILQEALDSITTPTQNQKKRLKSITEVREKSGVKGRPTKIHHPIIASVPDKGAKNYAVMKKRRQRDLNNIASQRCRAKKKMERIQEEQECGELENKNRTLKDQTRHLEMKIQRFKKMLEANNIPVPEFAA